MLGNWRKHTEYCDFITKNFREIYAINPHSLLEYETEILKLYILDKLKKNIAPLYSVTGRPSDYQPELFCSFVLMNSLKIPLDSGVTKLQHNCVLRIAIGVTADNIPCVSSHYDFINRLVRIDERSCIKIKKRMPAEKYGKNVKMPNRHPDIVTRLVDKILCGRVFTHCSEKTLQTIFARMAVESSIVPGIISENPDVSGEGTCIKTDASTHGVPIFSGGNTW